MGVQLYRLQTFNSNTDTSIPKAKRVVQKLPKISYINIKWISSCKNKAKWETYILNAKRKRKRKKQKQTDSLILLSSSNKQQDSFVLIEKPQRSRKLKENKSSKICHKNHSALLNDFSGHRMRTLARSFLLVECFCSHLFHQWGQLLLIILMYSMALILFPP